jgi:hypothetical protein
LAGLLEGEGYFYFTRYGQGWTPDALHAGIALTEDCDIFISRDKDFLKRRKTLKLYFEILEPHETVKRIPVSSKVHATLSQQGA